MPVKLTIVKNRENFSEIVGRIAEYATEALEIELSINRIKSIHPKTWRKIEDWGRETKNLSQYQYDMASNLGNIIRNKRSISDIQRLRGEEILNVVSEKNPELFFDMDEFILEDQNKNVEEVEITFDLIERIVRWDKKNKRLSDYKFVFLKNILDGKQQLNERNKALVRINLKTAEKYGFR